jgi:hypothetical protein
MFHLSDVFEPFLSVFEELSYQPQAKCKDYILPALKKMGAILVLMMVILVIVLLIYLGLGGSDDINIHDLRFFVMFVYVIPMMPTLMRSFVIYHKEKNTAYLQGILMFLGICLILGIAFYTEGIGLLTDFIIGS